ncbi:WXG100 family type VII secretion target [Nocardia sp. NPDC052278]|uniref:WXG100 family type VII secretion target n=1 Tax=unclassified Nocardia TaxID=2637762 RepID=UPI00368D2D8A
MPSAGHTKHGQLKNAWSSWGRTGTGWEGVAAQAYSEAHTKWAAAAREFAEGVRDMSDAARQAHAKYINAAEVNKQMLNGG